MKRTSKIELEDTLEEYLKYRLTDNGNTTKTKLVEGSFKFIRTSVDDLEQVLTKSKTIVEEKLV